MSFFGAWKLYNRLKQCKPCHLVSLLSPHCICVIVSQILPGVKVIIANTETKGPLGDSHLGEVSHCRPRPPCPPIGLACARPLLQAGAAFRGENGRAVGFGPVSNANERAFPCGQVWVSSPHNATGYYTVYGEEALHADHFSTKLSFGDTQTVWARTGYLGFLRRTELTDACGGEG